MTNNQNHELVRFYILFRDAFDIRFADTLDPGPVFFPVIRLFCVTACELVLGEGVGDLDLRGKCAREPINEPAFGSVQFRSDTGVLDIFSISCKTIDAAKGTVRDLDWNPALSVSG